MITDLKVMHHSLTESWELFPTYMNFVRLFCRDFDSDMSIPVIEQYLRMSFVSDQPTALMILALNEAKEPVGHMLAIAEQWFGNRVVTVVQVRALELLPKEKWNEAYWALHTFAKSHGARFVQFAARNRAAARLFRMRGYKENRVIMRAPVEGEAPLNPMEVG